MSATLTPKQINNFVIAVAKIEDATIAVKIKQAFCAIYWLRPVSRHPFRREIFKSIIIIAVYI